MGSATAASLGLYEYTTQTNQTKDGTNLVTIGYHYVATDTNGNPASTLWLGTPDYLLDASGNGNAYTNLANWQLEYFGYTGLNSNSDPFNEGITLLQDYQSGNDLTQLSFYLSTSNFYVATNLVSLNLHVSAGIPHYIAVLVDNTNFASATWSNYSSNVTANLGTNAGWHNVWVGLSPLPTNTAQLWQWDRFKLDVTPPVLVVTNPAVGTVSVPLVQVQGYSPEELNSISYDLTNAGGFWTNLPATIADQAYSTNTCEFTTNYFQCADVPLVLGTNIITLHATDMAGNISSTNLSIVLDYSTRTNAPAVALFWPQNGTLICNSNYTWRGWVDDPTATVVAQTVDTNGYTNTFNGTVERDGNFWVENLPLTSGTNWLTLTVTDSATNVATTNITVSPSAVAITINQPSDPSVFWTPPITVTGTISDSSDYTLWVNGVQASISSGNWTATNVPLAIGGTALIEARAIPNTDNGGNGAGGGGGGTNASYATVGNPTPTASPIDSELQIDKPPRLYVKTYQITQNQNYNKDITLTDVLGNWGRNTSQQGSSTNYTWTDGQGGSGSMSAFYSWTESGPSFFNSGTDANWQSQQSWPASSWPNLVDGTQTFSGFGYDPDADTNIVPPVINLEHCEVNWAIAESWVNYPTSTYAEELFATGGKNGNYTRTADTQIMLQTGGKGDPARQSLFQLSASGTQSIPNPAYAGTPDPQYLSQSIPAQNIQVTGQGMGTDGNLNLVFSANTGVDVTPKVPGIAAATYTLLQQQQALQIYVNDSLLEGNPIFCVGQYLTFSFNSLPGVATTNFNWLLGGTYFTSSNQPCSTCSVNYSLDPALLHNSVLTNCWWVSGGVYRASVYCSLIFANGNFPQPFMTSGNFSMNRPQAHVSTTTKSVTVDYTWGYLALNFGQKYAPYGPGILLTNTITMPPIYTGATNLKWTQVIDSTLHRIVTNDGSGATYILQGTNVLDGQDPYPWVDGYNQAYDSPGQRLDYVSAATASDTFTIWLMFQPTGGQWVPLRQVDWSWSGVANLSGSNWSWSGSGSAAPDTDSTQYPQWNGLAQALVFTNE